jgi:Ni,Fe-hydrogenase III small subunit
MIRIIRNSLRKGRVTRTIEALRSPEFEAAGTELSREIRAKFARSFRIREVDTGSCGACESEILAATNPLYDIQRFGVDFVASPRHADALLVTGPVSKNMELALLKTFEAVPAPKLVITLGDCARGGGLVKGACYTAGGVDGILPVAMHIPGCPPKPIDIIHALLAFLKTR